MSNYVLYPVLELRHFIRIMTGTLVLMTLFVLFLMGQRKRGIGDFKWQALFLGRTPREMWYMAFGAAQVCFILSVTLFSGSMGTVQIAALGLLCIAKSILGLSVQGFFGELFYGGLMGAALAIENLLRDYMRETGVELYIGTIWALLALFIVQYSIYYFIRGLERMLLRHEMAGRKKRKQKSES